MDEEHVTRIIKGIRGDRACIIGISIGIGVVVSSSGCGCGVFIFFHRQVTGETIGHSRSFVAIGMFVTRDIAISCGRRGAFEVIVTQIGFILVDDQYALTVIFGFDQ